MVSLGILDVFVKKQGVGLAIIGLGCMGFALTLKSFSFTAKVIASIFGLAVALFGLLLETPLLKRYTEGQLVSDFDD